MQKTKELIARCIDKDHRAWNEFSRVYEPDIRRAVRYKLNRLAVKTTRSEFLDIVQEVFLVMWEKDKLRTLRDVACLKAWLVMLAINVTTNYCRNKSYKMFGNMLSFETILKDRNGQTLGDLVMDTKSDTSGELESKDLYSMLLVEIELLPPKQQLAFKLHYFDNVKQKDVAAIMRMPAATMATFLKRTRDELKKKMRKYLK